MQRVIPGLLLLALTGLVARADEKPAKAPETKPATKAESAVAIMNELGRAFQKAKTPEERQKVLNEFSGKFAEYAEKHPKAADALTALSNAVTYHRGKVEKDSPVAKALAILEKDYVKTPKIESVIPSLQTAGDNGIAVLKAVMDKNPDKKVQAKACKAIVRSLEQAVQWGNVAKGNEKFRQQLENAFGKDRAAAIVDNLERNQKEIKELNSTLEKKYAGIFADLRVGKVAPEVVSQDIDGKKVTLSALRGKVVVLDIWATWCPPCRAMIPHERKLVERLKDKPFVLVSISGDAKLDTLKEFIKKEPMPWTHWWNGSSGGILADWEVRYFPTIYVLDAKGVIRYKDVRGEKMDEAVDKLLEEMDASKKGGKDETKDKKG